MIFMRKIRDEIKGWSFMLRNVIGWKIFSLQHRERKFKSFFISVRVLGEESCELVKSIKN